MSAKKPNDQQVHPARAWTAISMADASATTPQASILCPSRGCRPPFSLGYVCGGCDRRRGFPRTVNARLHRFGKARIVIAQISPPFHFAACTELVSRDHESFLQLFTPCCKIYRGLCIGDWVCCADSSSRRRWSSPCWPSMVLI